MTTRSKIPAVALAAALALPLTLTFQNAAAAQCQAQVDQVLQGMSIPQEDVKSVEIKSRGRGGKSSTNQAVDAWVRLKSCSGYVMITMTRHCVVQQTYTTGDCKMDSMPQY